MKLGMNYTHYDSGQLGVGVFFVAFAITGAILLLPGATKSSSSVLYVLIFGGLFVGVPATLGLGVFWHNSNSARISTDGKKPQTEPLPI